MSNSKTTAIVKLAVSAVLATGLIILFSVPIDPSAPPLGKLLFPGNGIWLVPTGYPRAEKHAIEAIGGKVTIFRDDWGVPHIYASGMNDIAFALGYVQAEDRLFFMDLARRFARGQLAEILGPGMLGTDMVTKTKLLEHCAEKMDAEIRQSKEKKYREVYEYVRSYVKGVNYYVQTHPDALSVEFRLLGYEFRPWTELDCWSIAYYMLEGGPWGYWDIDRLLVLASFMKRYGEAAGKEKFAELFGNPTEGRVLPYQVPVNPGYGYYPDITAAGGRVLKTGRAAPEGDIAEIAAAFGLLMERVMGVPLENKRTGMTELSGSNSWAVHGSKTASGKPLACSDSHEPWQIPNIYYEAHVVDSSSDYNFYGYYVAGGAGVPVDGHNRHVTWGMTVCQWDQIDWYYYRKVDEDRYLYNGKPRKYEDPVVTTIKVKGREPVTYVVRRTVHGPVFSGLGKDAPEAFRSLPASMKDTVIAARWLSHTSPMVKDMALCLLGMSKARNLLEFRAAMKNFEAPPNNITYADRDGNIYVHSMGGFPVRNNTNLPAWHLGNGFLPYNGSRGEGEWTGMVRFDGLPHAVNPPEKYVAGANQVAAGPEYLKKHAGQFRYVDGYRARRINELIAGGGNFTARDMMRIQTDVTSIRARDYTPHLVRALKALKKRDARLEKVLAVLSSWDFRMDKDRPAPSIVQAWMEYMLEETFRDEWKAMGLTGRLFPEPPVLEMLVRTNPASAWFDNIDTKDRVERAGDIILASLEKALLSLETFFKTPDVEKWPWGSLHQGEFAHMTGELPALNLGPVAINGAGEVVAASRNKLIQNGRFEPNNVYHGAHHRMVVDFGDLRQCRSVLPGGVSGLSTLGAPFDQFALFMEGGYHDEYFTATTPGLFLKECKNLTSTILLEKEGK